MKRNSRYKVAAHVILGLAAAFRANASEADASAWAQIEQVTSSRILGAERSSAIRNIYSHTIEPGLKHVENRTDGELHDTFRSLESAYYHSRTTDYSYRSSYGKAMAAVLAQLHARHEQQPEEVDSYYDGLVAARDFAAASTLVREYPGLSFKDYRRFSDPVDNLSPGAPSAYTAIDASHLALASVDLPKEGAYVIVVIGCHLAKDAAREIEADESLMAAMASSRVYWIFSDLELTQQALNEWNRSFPSFKARIAYDNSTWTGVDFESTPSIHLFRDGKLEKIQRGWGKSSLDTLRESLASLGMADNAGSSARLAD